VHPCRVEPEQPDAVVGRALRVGENCVGVPQPGTYVERLNTDSQHYGGSNVGTPLGRAASMALPAHGRPQSIVIDLPPLATVMFEWTPP